MSTDLDLVTKVNSNGCKGSSCCAFKYFSAERGRSACINVKLCMTVADWALFTYGSFVKILARSFLKTNIIVPSNTPTTTTQHTRTCTHNHTTISSKISNYINSLTLQEKGNVRHSFGRDGIPCPQLIPYSNVDRQPNTVGYLQNRDFSGLQVALSQCKMQVQSYS